MPKNPHVTRAIRKAQAKGGSGERAARAAIRKQVSRNPKLKTEAQRDRRVQRRMSKVKNKLYGDT